MIALDDRSEFSGLSAGILLHRDKKSIVVAVGVTVADLIQVLNDSNLMYLPHPEYTRSLIGGNIGTNASGP